MVKQVKPSRLKPKLDNRIEEVKVIDLLLEYRARVIQKTSYDTGEYARQISQLFPQPLGGKEVAVTEIEEPPDETCATEEELRQMERDATAKAEPEAVSQPLDDKELREKIADEFYNARASAGDMPFSEARAMMSVMAVLAYAKADQILALLSSIEEAKREERERIADWLYELNDKGDFVCCIQAELLKYILEALEGGE